MQLQRCPFASTRTARRCAQHCTVLAPPRVVTPDRMTETSGRYIITDSQREAFRRDGFVHLEGVMTEEEMAQHVDPVYSKFVNGEMQVPSKDKLDAAMDAPMAPHADLQDSTLLNVMLPRKFVESWQGNLLEKRAEDIACQLLETDEVDLDFDQILAKRPRSRQSGMPWHQDAAAWPPELNGSDCATANMWVAVSDAPIDSGCLRYVPGSHKEGPLRPHELVGPEEGQMRTQVRGERAVMVPMKRGDIVVHSERVVHGSGPNLTDKWRCGYILNFKRSTCNVAGSSFGTAPSNATDASEWAAYQKKVQN